MRKYILHMSLLTLLFSSAVLSLAQTNQANRPALGKWQLNVEKSKSNGALPNSETVTITPDGKTAVEGVSKDGKAYSWSFIPSQGASVPIQGMENATVVETHSGGNSVDHVWKVAGGNSKGHGVVSPDGKTMTYTQDGVDGKGSPVHVMMIFDKQ